MSAGQDTRPRLPGLPAGGGPPALPRDTRDLADALKRELSGEVRFDDVSRVLYSTDASIYQMTPLGVVFPRNADDVQAVVQIAATHRAPLLPRGAGTSLSGQTVNHAIVLDFSRHMNKVLEFNAEEHWALVQPGLVVERLNRQGAAHGLRYAPDPTTINRATIGGGIGNNSCGSHSVVYGKTIDHVRDLTVVLADASRASFGPGNGRPRPRSGLEGAIYRELPRIAVENRAEVIARFPKILRRVSGYNLDDFIGVPDPVGSQGSAEDPGPNFARMVVGSEGTLCIVTEASVNLVTVPARRGLAVLHFHDMAEACNASWEMLQHGPAAVELIGRMIIERCRESLGFARLASFLEGDPDSILVVELAAGSDRELQQKLQDFKDSMGRQHIGYACLTIADPAAQGRIWEMRDAGLGLLMSTKGDAKPFPYVEDTAVDPQRLGDYVRRFDQIVREHGTTAGYYGHASVGCLHIRPLVDLKTKQGTDRMVSLAAAVSDLVLEFGGSLSGEHGDGIVRGVWNEKMFGPRLYQAFREVKGLFDPENIMNPGKIVDCPPMAENLRFGPSYHAAAPATTFDFSRDVGFAGAVEMCNGMGACRKDDGVMCPSFMVTREEEHSTRGRANLLRAVLTGALPGETLASEKLHHALDLCIECKGCKAECQTGVDMTKLKYEFLGAYRKMHPASLRDRLFAHINAVGRWGCWLGPLASWASTKSPSRALMHRFLGIHRSRPLPPLARETMGKWWRQRAPTRHVPDPRPADEENGREVVLFNDTFMDHHYPEIGIAAVEVLERAGLTVRLLRPACCGRPMLSKGFLEAARANARRNVDLLHGYAARGVPVVGCEPSCVLTFRDEYPDLLRDEPSQLVARNTFLIDEFLAGLAVQERLGLKFKVGTQKVLFHGHCHQKALTGTHHALSLLRMPPGSQVEESQAGCCGMAGAFGYEKEHYDMSVAMARQQLVPAVETLGPEWELAVMGVSCRQQLEHLTGRRVRHVIQVLRDALV